MSESRFFKLTFNYDQPENPSSDQLLQQAEERSERHRTAREMRHAFRVYPKKSQARSRDLDNPQARRDLEIDFAAAALHNMNPSNSN